MPMLLRKILHGFFAFCPLLAWGQSPDLPSQAEPPPPGAIAHSPVGRPIFQTGDQPGLQSFLDAQSDMDRRKMLDKQQRTFQLEIDGRYAKALKAYCDTGYGDERCFRPEIARPAPLPLAPAPASASPGGSNAPPPPVFSQARATSNAERELPTVAQISGFGEELTAVLAFAGGKRLRVMGPGPNGPRSQLPDGESVVSIRPGEVLVSRPGEARPIPLLFQNAAGGYGALD